MWPTASGIETRPGRRHNIVAVVTAAVFVLPVCSSGDPTMPDLSGMSKDEATFILLKEGVEDWTVEWHEGANPLVVVDQEPEPGDPVTEETEALVVLSGE